MAGCQKYTTITVLFLVCLASISRPAIAGNTAKGLLGYYTFDNQTVDDSSGHGHNGKTHGPVTYTSGVGASGYAMSVNASPKPGEAKLPPGPFAQTKSLTVAFWFNPAESQAQEYSAMIYRANQIANSPNINWSDRSYAIWYISGGLHVNYTVAGATSETICLSQSFGLQSGTWHHVALVLDSATMAAIVYLDGVPVQTCAYPGGVLASGYKALVLGNAFNKQLNNAGAFTGALDDVRLYARALPPEEIRQIYNDVSNFNTLFTFTGPNGSKPNGVPILYNGVIYGTTVGGGANNDGTLWGYTLASNSLSTLHSFVGSDGAQPRGELAAYSGALYGSTAYGGAGANAGLLYSFDIENSTLSPIYSFNGAGDGSAPGGGLIVYDGNTILGAAASGGQDNNGSIFQVSLQNDVEKTLYSFPGGANGSTPDGGLTLGPGSVIYGATEAGGTANAGTLFSIPAGGTNLSVLYTFPGGSAGKSPNGGMVFDNAGNLYGTTLEGGSSNQGTIFRYVPGTGAFSVLYTFTGGDDGGRPDGYLLIDSQSNLYGAARQGGADGDGTIFTFNLASGQLNTLYTFTGQADGENPNGGLTEDSSGALYGTTANGGINGFGTLFKLVR